MAYVIVYHYHPSNHGKEVIDEFETKQEAEAMLAEYRVAMGGPDATITMRRKRPSDDQED